MSVFQVKRGRNIKLKGLAEQKIEAIALPAQIAISPSDFRSFRPRILVKVGDSVKVGTPILENKDHLELKIVSSVSGKVLAINRGQQRMLLNVIIATDGRQDALSLKSFSAQQIKDMSRDDVVGHLLAGGVWAFIRQRPFSKIAHPSDQPKAIFVQGMSTEPLALNVDVILEGKEREFQVGLDVLRKLTTGPVHVCTSATARSKALTSSKNVEIHQFKGPHPAGNVSTHIQMVDPINKGECVWYIGAQDVLRIAHMFLNGQFLPECFVAVTGEGAHNRNYKKQSLAHL